MRAIKMWRISAFAVVLFLASCAGQYSDNPEIKSLQVWSDTCYSYTQVLKTVNDMIELEILSDSQIDVVRNVRDFVGPLCELENPPLYTERDAIQQLIDAELIKLIKLQKGLE